MNGEMPIGGQRRARGEWRRALDRRPPVYIGAEATAAGFRLAGLEVHTPSDDELAGVFRRALRQTDLLLIDVNYARRLPEREIREAALGLSPLLLIVPDILGRTPMRELEQRLASELGVHL
jgi:vacuolar-type H+-ATPase subunit F/Vma7